jgi:hypothetical protein
VSIEAIFKFVAYTVPGIMVLGGLLLLVLGYPIDNSSMVAGGWGLILLGATIYVFELVLAYYSSE